MGIEKFFRTIQKETTSVIETNYKSLINFLYFDFNSIIYNIYNVIDYELNYIIYCNIYNKTTNKQYVSLKNKWRNIVKLNPIEDIQELKNSKEKQYELTIKGIEEYILNIIKTFTYEDKLDTIFIAMDGIPSYGKVIEQKKRRLMAFLQQNIVKGIKEHFGIKSYELYEEKGKIDKLRIEYDKYKLSMDRSELIPNSNLMDTISTFLVENFKKKVQKVCPNLKTYIYTGNDEYGEGERKIIWHIIKNMKEGNYAIHSPDADVVLLGTLAQNKLSIKKKICKFLILRAEFRNDNLFYDIIDCSEIKKNIINRLGNKENENNFLNDVILLYTFFGEDFLPRIETVQTSTSFLTIIDFYKEYYDLNKKFLINDGKLSFENLKNMFKILSSHEKQFASDFYMFKNFKNYNFLLSVLNCLTVEFIKKTNEANEKFNEIKKLTPYKQEEELNKDTYLKEILLNVSNKSNLQESIKWMNSVNCILKLEKKDNKISRKMLERIQLSSPLKISKLDIETFKINSLLMEYVNIFNAKDELELGKIKMENCKIKKIKQDKSKEYYETYFKDDKDEVILNYLSIFKYVFDVYFNDIDKDNRKQTIYYRYNKSPLLKDIYNFLEKNEKIEKKIDKIIEQGYVDKYFNKEEHATYVKPVMNDEMREFIDMVVRGISTKKFIDCRNVYYFNKCHYKDSFNYDKKFDVKN